MRLAIVGTSKVLSPRDKKLIMDGIDILYHRYKPDVLISGGASGVDSLVREYCTFNRLPLFEFRPSKPMEEEFLKRNRQIAEDADVVISISTKVHNKKCYHHDTPQPHQKTAGCYTARHAEKLGKKTELVVVG